MRSALLQVAVRRAHSAGGPGCAPCDSSQVPFESPRGRVPGPCSGHSQASPHFSGVGPAETRGASRESQRFGAQSEFRPGPQSRTRRGRGDRLQPLVRVPGSVCPSPPLLSVPGLCPHLDAAPRRRAARGLRGACRPRRGSHSSLALARGSGPFPGFGGCELSLRKHAQRVLEEASLSRLSRHGAAETVGRAACAESRGSFWVRGAGAVADDSGAHRTRPPGGTRPPGP